MAAQFLSDLAPAAGLLPKWLLLVSLISVANSIQCYSTLSFTKRVYSGVDRTLINIDAKKFDTPSSSPSGPSPVNALSARTFGTWTFLSSVIRLYAAYHVHNPVVYQLALWTYGVAFVHFMSEWWVFGTARWGAGIAGPAVVSSVTLVWMFSQWGWYVGA